jgi:hypothetical protein
MNTHLNSPSKTSYGKFRVIWPIIGIVTFGVLMGLREELPSIWLRALVSSIAAVFFVICILRYHRKTDQ